MKIFKTQAFYDYDASDEMADFINENHISQEQIQSLTVTPLNNYMHLVITLFYWEWEEE